MQCTCTNGNRHSWYHVVHDSLMKVIDLQWGCKIPNCIIADFSFNYLVHVVGKRAKTSISVRTMISLMSSSMMKLNQHLTSRRRAKRDAHHGWTKLLIHIGKSKTDRTGTFAFRNAGHLRRRCSDIAGMIRWNHRNRTMHGKTLMMSSATGGPISGTSTTPRAHFWPEVYNQLNRFIRLV